MTRRVIRAAAHEPPPRDYRPDTPAQHGCLAALIVTLFGALLIAAPNPAVWP